MLDYRTQSAALGALEDALAALAITDPDVARLRDLHLDDVSSSPASALLGSLLDHVIWHATLGKQELDLVEEAATLWGHGLDLYDALDRFRVALQQALDHPLDATTVATLNTAGNALRVLVPSVQQQMRDLQALRAKVAGHDYVPEHPRQHDAPVDTWSWSDLLQARRTDALVRELFHQASTVSTRAFALGVLARYGADVSGALYVSQTVGGPRRGHLVRNRVARNSVGSWLQAHHPGMSSLTGLADLLEAQLAGGVGPDLETLLTDALDATYPMPSLPSPPSLQDGFERLLTHLRLLDGFRVPPPPSALSDRVVASLLGDPTAPYVPTLTEQISLVESGGQPGVAGSGAGVHIQSVGDDGPAHQEPPDSTEVKCGAFWESLGWSLLFLLGGWFACVVKWAGGDRCKLWDDITQNWEAAFDNGVYVGSEVDTDFGAQSLTTTGMEALAQRQEPLQLAADLFTLQASLWEGLHKGADFLALHGLIYPDEHLTRWRYRQFTVIPAHDKGWPRLPYLGARFDNYPGTAPELPHEEPRFLPGAPPSAILTGISGGGQLSATSVSLSLWGQIASGAFDADNLDLDADRGWRHPCWQPRGSIGDQPLDVVQLTYTDI